MNIVYFIDSFTIGHLSCFLFFTVNNAAINILTTEVFMWTEFTDRAREQSS